MLLLLLSICEHCIAAYGPWKEKTKFAVKNQ